MKLEWKESQRSFYSVCHNLYLGKKHIGNVLYPSFDGKYSAFLLLDDYVCDFDSLEDAKAFVETCVKEWVSEAGLTGVEQ